MKNNQGITTTLSGLILMIVGLLFLAGQMFNVRLSAASWPFAIIGFGLLMFVGMAAGGRSAGGLAIPASMIVTTGLILLYQNTYNYFESWSYCWGLLVAANGAGTVINSYWSGKVELRKKGWSVAMVGAMIFLLLGTFFELFIYHRNFQSASSLWPLALILVGAGLIASRFIGKHSTQNL